MHACSRVESFLVDFKHCHNETSSHEKLLLFLSVVVCMVFIAAS